MKVAEFSGSRIKFGFITSCHSESGKCIGLINLISSKCMYTVTVERFDPRNP